MFFKRQTKKEIVRQLVRDVYDEEVNEIANKEKELIRREIQATNREKELSNIENIEMKSLYDVVSKQKDYQLKKEEFERKMTSETDEYAISAKTLNHTLIFIKWLTKQDGKSKDEKSD